MVQYCNRIDEFKSQSQASGRLDHVNGSAYFEQSIIVPAKARMRGGNFAHIDLECA